eukprot:8532975-Alexandrium_andersonii.AAC.1
MRVCMPAQSATRLAACCLPGGEDGGALVFCAPMRHAPLWTCSITRRAFPTVVRSLGNFARAACRARLA